MKKLSFIYQIQGLNQFFLILLAICLVGLMFSCRANEKSHYSGPLGHLTQLQQGMLHRSSS